MSKLVRLYDHKATLYTRVERVKLSADLEKVTNDYIDRVKKAKLHNIENLPELVGQLADYDVRMLEMTHCGGYCNYVEKEIGLVSSYTLTQNQWVVCHELGHVIQDKLGQFEDNYTFGQCLLSESMRIEQEAQAIGVRLYKALFTREDLPAHELTYGFDWDSATFLTEFFGEWSYNDLYKTPERLS